ncbi:hypothetical protein EH165_13915 [Nakamurella antarctica]|uniref:Regulator of SigK n=1 Tax=Nakamurella antarctica TaxID=1902245 RepID=A0A3G8ZP81_9ACTN|nr:anti-sigma factor [Nakamurella antarctica]AZI59073.1 hypothetical protein EH165_13915 [Nakamurella antarctica]
MMVHDPSLAIGGAALDALDEHEHAELDSHLVNCEMCTAELRGFRETAARLGAAVAQAPPVTMRGSVMALLAVTRQLPPEVGAPQAQSPAAGSSSTRAGSLRSVSSLPPDSGNAREAAASDSRYAPVAGVDEPAEQRSAEQRSAEEQIATHPAAGSLSGKAAPGLASVTDISTRRRFTGRLLAAAAVIVVAIGGFSIFRGTSDENPEAAMASCVGVARDTHALVATDGSKAAAAADVQFSSSCGGAIIRLSKVGALTADKTYQLWVITDNNPRSVDTMVPDSDGTMPVVVVPVGVGDVLGVTVEPTGGSALPTSDAVVKIPVT